MKPARPRELLYSRHINQEEIKMEDKSEDWQLVSCIGLDNADEALSAAGSSKNVVGIITVDGNLVTCSIIQVKAPLSKRILGQRSRFLVSQRVNRPSSPTNGCGVGDETSISVASPGLINLISASSSASASFRPSSNKSPSISRPPSTEKDIFTPLAVMAQAKCAVGTGCLQGKLVVCGEFTHSQKSTETRDE